MALHEHALSRACGLTTASLTGVTGHSFGRWTDADPQASANKPRSVGSKEGKGKAGAGGTGTGGGGSLAPLPREGCPSIRGYADAGSFRAGIEGLAPCHISDQTIAVSNAGGSRKLETVFFTDIVGSTEVAAEVGDAKWKSLVNRHNQIVRQALKRFGGREVDTAGDGVFAVFDVPARAIRCAWAVVGDVQELGIDVRAGLHVGEVELAGRQVRGIAVHTGARVCNVASAAQILVTSSLMEMVAGSGVEFVDVGEHQLKGIDGSRHLFAVAKLDGASSPAPVGAEVGSQRRASIDAMPLPRRRRWVATATIVSILLIAGTAWVVRPSASSRTPGSIGPPLGSLVEVDPANGHVIREFDQGFAVNERTNPELQIGEGGLWLLTDSRLYRLDESSGAVRPSETAVAFAIDSHEVFVARGALYAPNPGVAVIDPATGEVIRQRSVHDYLEGIGLSKDAVWLAGGEGVRRIDPTSLQTTATISINGGASGVVTSGTDAWATSTVAGTLTKIDTQTTKVLGRPTALSTTPDRIVAGFGQLWILDRSEGLVVVADETTGALLDTIPIGAEASDIAVGDDDVWVATSAGTLVRIDHIVHDIVSRVAIHAPVAALAEDPETGQLWVFVGEQPSSG